MWGPQPGHATFWTMTRGPPSSHGDSLTLYALIHRIASPHIVFAGCMKQAPPELVGQPHRKHLLITRDQRTDRLGPCYVLGTPLLLWTPTFLLSPTVPLFAACKMTTTSLLQQCFSIPLLTFEPPLPLSPLPPPQRHMTLYMYCKDPFTGGPSLCNKLGPSFYQDIF